jgi:hypothetical protein
MSRQTAVAEKGYPTPAGSLYVDAGVILPRSAV